MDPQTLVAVLTAFTVSQSQMLLTLEALMNDKKQLPHTLNDTRHKAIICYSMLFITDYRWPFVDEIIDVEEMVAKFLHILVHDVENRVIQREFVQSGETVSRHFNLVLLVVVRLHDKLIKKLVPVTNTCMDPRWKCFEVRIVEVTCQYVPLMYGHLFKPAKLSWDVGWDGISYMYWRVKKNPQQIHAFSRMRLHDQMNCKY
ncbi:transposase [Cucumis melo var. makuwa]|uniref:Transposase n=1 Tax=Cucumis melo var. makuwa TaxID=1194695 RepID=A0A5D3DF30_CUCMM|nr:transposase [Cucumis melo var. makuwa]